MQTRRSLALSTLVLLAAATSNAAPIIFTGYDGNPTPDAALSVYPNASAAEADFLALWTAGFAPAYTAQTTLTFRGAGPMNGVAFGPGLTPATIIRAGNHFGHFAGNDISVAADDLLRGHYGLSGTGSHLRYLESSVNPSTAGFFINFFDPGLVHLNSVRGFGFYGIGIGDLAGCIQLTLYAVSGAVTDLAPTCPGGGVDSRGAVLFYGFIDNEFGPAHEYLAVRIRNEALTSEDVFAFDRITMLSLPEPASSTMIAVSAALLGIARLRRRRP